MSRSNNIKGTGRCPPDGVIMKPLGAEVRTEAEGSNVIYMSLGLGSRRKTLVTGIKLDVLLTSQFRRVFFHLSQDNLRLVVCQEKHSYIKTHHSVSSTIKERASVQRSEQLPTARPLLTQPCALSPSREAVIRRINRPHGRDAVDEGVASAVEAEQRHVGARRGRPYHGAAAVASVDLAVSWFKGSNTPPRQSRGPDRRSVFLPRGGGFNLLFILVKNCSPSTMLATLPSTRVIRSPSYSWNVCFLPPPPPKRPLR